MKTTKVLNLNKDFRRLYNSGRTVVTPVVVVYSKKNRLDHSRIGITVSKKIGKAHERNRARRVIREAYRLLEDEVPKGMDFVFVARKRTTTCKMQDVYRVLKKNITNR